MNKNLSPLSERLNKNLNDERLDGFIIFDGGNVDFPVLFASEDFIKLTGIDEKKLLNKPLFNNEIFLESETEKQRLQKDINDLKESMIRVHIQTTGKNLIVYKMMYKPLNLELDQRSLYIATFFNLNKKAKEAQKKEIDHLFLKSINNQLEAKEILHQICQTVEKHSLEKMLCNLILYNQEDSAEFIMSDEISQETKDSLQCVELRPYINYFKQKLQEDPIYIMDDMLKEPYIYFPTNNENELKYKKVILYAVHDEQKRVIGTFVLGYKESVLLETVDLTIFEYLSSIIVAVNMLQNHQTMRQKYLYKDKNTGLPNMDYFKKNIQEKLSHQSGYICILSPKEYADIVDLYGRKIGNVLLKQIAKRIMTLDEKDNGIIASFATNALILFTEESKKANPYSTLKSLTEKSFIVEGYELFISLKVGASPINSMESLEESIRRADQAFSKAMQEPGDNIQLFKVEDNEKLYQERQMYNRIIHGLQEREFTAFLQPKVSLHTSKIIGFEALARWQTKNNGIVSPAEFIPIAENTGKIIEIEDMILEKVLNWLSERREEQKPLYQVAVNISPLHFYKKDFVYDLVNKLQNYEIDPQYIKIEITESIGLEDIQKAREIIDHLKLYGFETSMDDFGKGYSSLNYLTELAFSEIKIDKSFIDYIDNPKTLIIIQTIIRLADHLNMKTVAEGIEKKEQFEQLKKVGCAVGQGYYYHKPMSLQQANEVLGEM